MAGMVFISHHHAHRAEAEELCSLLERGGVRCWMAPRDIRPGRDWAGAIVEAIDGSSVLLVLESPGAAESGHMMREISFAAGAGRRIVRLVLPGCGEGRTATVPGIPPGSPVLSCGETVAGCLPDLLPLLGRRQAGRWRTAARAAIAAAAVAAAGAGLLRSAGAETGWPDGIRFVGIPAGDGVTGSPDDEEFRWQGEGPLVEVRADSFEIMATEVTRDMWTRVMGTTQEDLVRSAGREDIEAFVPPGERGALPVVMVTWSDAMAFAEALGRLDTLHAYRLPTEAEWEYACRAGQPGSYCGESAGLSIDEVSWHLGNSGLTLHPAGSLAPNAWGLYDMLGNVSEWCLDSWREDRSGSSGIASDTVPGRSGFRVQRGSSFVSSCRLHRCAFRAMAIEDMAYHALGFRVARFPR